MSENKNNMVNSAMNYAIPLGIFWIFKYIFFMLGDYSALSLYIYNFLTVGTLVVYYFLISRYRDKDLGGEIEYGHVILFSLLLFLFASVLEIAVVALHIFVLKPEFLDEFKEQLITVAERFSVLLGDSYVESIKMFASNMGGYYIFSYLLNNIFTGLFLSLIIGYFVSKQKTNHQKYN